MRMGSIFQFINKRVADQAEDVQARFLCAQPFAHIAIDDFLTDEYIEELVSEFPSAKDPAYKDFCVKKDGKPGSNYINTVLTDFPPAFQKLDQVMRSEKFRAYITRLTGISDLEYDDGYLDGGIGEFRDNGFAPPVCIGRNHHPKTLHHRRIKLVLYLNKDWKSQMGGNFQLHLDPVEHAGRSLTGSIEPKCNRCLIFETSETSWHGIDPLQKTGDQGCRVWSIYFYSKNRPDADQISLRNAEYVEPPVPDHITAGHVLSEADVLQLNEGIARRDARIRMLYGLRREFDSKYKHLWSEYEYYLDRSRKLERQINEAKE